MHITMEADYAIRIVIYLARENRRVDANTISENTGVSLRFALKILRNLVGSGLVRSFKGTQGGYELNRAPQEITLRELLEVVEGPYMFSRCLEPSRPASCTRPSGDCCKPQQVFAEISRTVRQMLEEVSIAQLI